MSTAERRASSLVPAEMAKNRYDRAMKRGFCPSSVYCVNIERCNIYASWVCMCGCVCEYGYIEVLGIPAK